MTPDNGSTKRCENRCVGGSGDGRIEYDHVWSRGRTDIRFGSRYDVSDGAILKTWERAQDPGGRSISGHVPRVGFRTR